MLIFLSIAIEKEWFTWLMIKLNHGKYLTIFT